MKTTNFKRRNDILEEGSGDEVMLYHQETDELHVLNPTARLIWELCDGEHTVSDMVCLVRTEFAVAPKVDLQADVQQTLAEFHQKNLLQV